MRRTLKRSFRRLTKICSNLRDRASEGLSSLGAGPTGDYGGGHNEVHGGGSMGNQVMTILMPQTPPYAWAKHALLVGYSITVFGLLVCRNEQAIKSLVSVVGGKR